MEMIPSVKSEKRENRVSPFDMLLENEKVKNRFLVSLEELFSQVEVLRKDSEDLIFKIKDILEEGSSEEVFISKTRDLLEEYKVYEGIKNVRSVAIMAKVETVAPFLGSQVLDVGAGSGRLASVIESETDSSVTLVDVEDLNETDLPYSVYDGETLPFDDDSQDTVLLMMVLHHSLDPEKVLKEAGRVSRGNIVISEPVYLDNEMDKHRSLCVDWFIARVLQKSDMPVPGEMKSVAEWEQKFTELGFEIEVSEAPGNLDQSKISFLKPSDIVVERSWVFVLKQK